MDVTVRAPQLTAAFWRSRRSAAIAGIVFGVLLLVALTMLRIALSADSLQSLRTDTQRRTLIRLSLNLVPFAGIAFLWFIGVLRDQLGAVEDRLFLHGLSRQRAALRSDAVRRRGHLDQPDGDARRDERQRRGLRVRPQHHPVRLLRLRHANGCSLHARGEHGWDPDLCRAALGLLPRIPDRPDPAGGRRRLPMDPAGIPCLGSACEPCDPLRPPTQPRPPSRAGELTTHRLA